MTTTFTLIDDKYSANDSTGKKHIFGTVSMASPYTTGGESVTTSTYFPVKFLGGKVLAVEPNVSIHAAGRLQNSVFRGDADSVTSAVLQVLDVGVGTSFGGMIDCSVNLQSATATVEMWGY